MYTMLSFSSAHKKKIQVHNIPKCDVCGMIAVAVVLWMCFLVVMWQNGMVHHHHFVDQVRTHPNRWLECD